ncbi:serine/threonine protein kinase [Paenarthrobacter sp. AR 02]|uniref:serine/threonine-protein kinase n=1 Tax=Paenarthrobacter sp. AR 02 TaxID=2899821 RepID=UPI001F17360D|nr:serine/threonine-protein kinase [Paenarthrobacter sp. AR 02]MCF3140643.1 serine/threonine protein kinase [Paenarthrobacter sp. AR 02]
MGNNDEAVDSRVPDSIDDTLDGRYQLGPVLGRGAMSTVYRATDLLLGRDVAIKIFLPGSGDDSFRARQETEMRLLASFDHPGLVAAFDVGVDTRNDEERAYLVMELAEGRDLRALLADGPLTVPEVARIGAQIAGALSQVHGHGVIHRDIKPANILVSDDAGLAQKVKLADFGVALVVNDSRLTATGFTVGTAQYLSPEQAQGLGLTPASDIYSLGLVLLECLTGKAEYPGTPIETASARLHRAPEIPAGLPAPLRSLLVSMTDMDPGKRPAAAGVEQALADDRIQAGRRTAVLPPLPSRPPVRAAETKVSMATVMTLHKRRPKTVWGVGAAAVTVPLALVLFTQGLAPSGSTADNSLPAESEVSQADPQPAAPVVPVVPTPAGVTPVEADPAAAVPAEVVNLPQPAPVPAVQAPAPVPAVVPGAVTADEKGKDRGGNKPDKQKGSGPAKQPKDR